MSDHVSDVKKRKYLPQIIGYLMAQYVHTNNAKTKKEIERLKRKLAEVHKRLGLDVICHR
jgi:hypothetical protein